ncbi:hypothetical protein N656DRAFT_712503 [Canariomyces notabilis]|uniref:Shugoshin n=1 Tax=Canariomyces notabilis TaxID=2074819 RepID=A0AAN6TB92_9PEZI|nr:hypothetical protein N656DRAFT_712503 [Canariomyces arenarius]
MARLNEPPAPVESHLDILRRKFLRQNRDIAKINSDQSQKIRRLENDCARLLSENLELRAQVLRLEKEVENNSARRIADHALEIKAKLEAQLSEFGSLLSSLGMEPPSKRHLSEGRRIAKPRHSMTRSPPQRKRRETPADAEALAEQEGRLPPIYENKSYPRVTMNSEEILALCAAAADTTDSPELGPPPVSRFVEEEHNKHNSPTRISGMDMPESPNQSPSPKRGNDGVASSSPERSKELDHSMLTDANQEVKAASPRQPMPKPTPQATKAGTKRKFGDETERTEMAGTGLGKENTINAGNEKAATGRGNQKRRSIKEIPANRREKAGGARTPLGIKSTNEDMSSPRKGTKGFAMMEGKKEQSESKDYVAKETSHPEKPLPKIEIPPPEPPAVITVMLEQETVLPSATPSSPTTPDRLARKDMQHDTPPPADISSNGETSRPSRRARPAISYAEPNLRDKMRRPTKELFDAVSGEGKFVHRLAAPTKPDEQNPGSVRKANSEAGSSISSSKKPLPAGETASRAQVLSPLGQKDDLPDSLPSTVVTERRKRPSAVGVAGSRESINLSDGPDSARAETLSSLTITAHNPEATVSGATGSSSKRARGATTPATESQHPSAVVAAAVQSVPDIYDFASSSFASDNATGTIADSPDAYKPATTAHSSGSNTTTSRSRTARKSSMAAAAAMREMLDDQELDEGEGCPALKPRSSSSSSARKRASMLAPKKTALMEAVGEAQEDEGSTRDKISRRRSMML